MTYLVIKCGGSVLEALPESFYENIVHLQKELGVKPVIVHGGGPLISSLLKKMGTETTFVNGLRVTTEEVLDVVEMVLSGSVNKQIVRHLVEEGGNAYGLSGIDGGLLKAKKLQSSVDLGFVGEIFHVETKLISQLGDHGYIPVISPLGIDERGQRYNINGDIAAAEVAKALGARLCLISDIPGLYVEEGTEKKVLHTVTKDDILELMDNEVITGGMIPKVKSAVDALEHGVPEVSIINGMTADALIDFCTGKEIGTKIILAEEVANVH
ncbi:acetylglutamate kinase [Pseudalkalibacillus salsuginis]|uniref:acetylglutamate kinase n=1 Tax=Pseudalkalibacillus salsuginis TaxID=2910972 RepID=UPI001F37B8DB|nr:acetylglutamate kinase [Pseudalkalibacillus salsuginis]MCF6409457.1 acetylglutamate kinase [Pseudalkalibacillus salsuginis]